VQQQELATAAAAYEQAIAAAPELSAPYVSLGVLWARVGDLGAAWDALSRGMDQVEDSPQMVYNSALVLALGGKNQQAIAFFEHALALDPGYLEARENLAGMLASVGRYEESLFHYRQALMQSPQDAVTRYLAGRVLVALGRNQEAREELEESLEIDPGLWEAQELLDTLE
jgi:tetratricopeptide (TPR) repeat protein